jgi:hypothetical protein
MTDHDEICPNSTLHGQLLEIFGRVLPIYERPGCKFDKKGGAIPFRERSVEMNDLLSLPDLAAGTLGDYLSKRAVLPPDEILVKPGTDKVLLWLGNPSVGLKKCCFFLRKIGDSIARGSIAFAPVDPPPATLIPIYD